MNDLISFHNDFEGIENIPTDPPFSFPHSELNDFEAFHNDFSHILGPPPAAPQSSTFSFPYAELEAADAAKTNAQQESSFNISAVSVCPDPLCADPKGCYPECEDKCCKPFYDADLVSNMMSNLGQTCPSDCRSQSCYPECKAECCDQPGDVVHEMMSRLDKGLVKGYSGPVGEQTTTSSCPTPCAKSSACFPDCSYDCCKPQSEDSSVVSDMMKKLDVLK